MQLCDSARRSLRSCNRTPHASPLPQEYLEGETGMHQNDDGGGDLPTSPWLYALAVVLLLAVLAYGWWM